jgi:acetolactate synthase-1/2/3 large subunit
LIGNGAVRAGAAGEVAAFVDSVGAPFTTTFMAKGAVSDEHPLRLATTGLSENEHAACGFDQADLVIAIGYDLVEYDPGQWHRDKQQPILHIDVLPAEVDRNYAPDLSIVGDIADSLSRLTTVLRIDRHKPSEDWAKALRDEIRQYESELTTSDAFPVKPQRLLHDLRLVMAEDDILISDVGAHKVWIAHQWQSLSPNTCIISNGFAAMGIGLPGAIAAKLAYPERMVVAATGDAGFLMNAQELETALRLKLAIVVLVWNDGGYGLIEWHQDRRFGYSNDVAFGNPDFVAFAQSFGACGFRVESAGDLLPTLQEAVACGTVAVVDCPVDYAENMRLTERLGRLTCTN